MNARETQGAPSVEHLCELGRVSRAGFYRFGEVRAPKRAEADLRDKIQTIALKNRFYGYRRVCRELWRAHGLKVNHKHVLRLMREDNLLRLREEPFVPYTTNSRHEFPIVANLTRGRVPTGLDQIWVADITYVRLAGQFVYLAVVLDAFSRRVIGWALADHLEARLAVDALDMALAARNPEPGLIHHSDRGVQYACADYSEKLSEREVLISMSRAGNPYDNAKAERFMRTLKEEEVNGKTYASIDEARTDIGAFLENVYNRGGLHSALGYKPPVEFEAELRQLETI
jgi:putative transposase